MDNNNKRGNKPPVYKNPLVIFLAISIIATIVLNVLMAVITSPKTEEISYNEFLSLVEEDKVDEVVINHDKFTIFGKAEKKNETAENIFGISMVNPAEDRRPVYYTGYLNDERLFEKLDELLREYFILTAETYGLTQREIFLGKERGAYSVEHRRNMLVAYEQLVEGRCTPQAFETVLESYGLTDFEIVEDYYGQKVKINVRDNLTDAIRTMVEERVLLDFPVHLEIIVNFEG